MSLAHRSVDRIPRVLLLLLLLASPYRGNQTKPLQALSSWRERERDKPKRAERVKAEKRSVCVRKEHKAMGSVAESCALGFGPINSSMIQAPQTSILYDLRDLLVGDVDANARSSLARVDEVLRLARAMQRAESAPSTRGALPRAHENGNENMGKSMDTNAGRWSAACRSLKEESSTARMHIKALTRSLAAASALVSRAIDVVSVHTQPSSQTFVAETVNAPEYMRAPASPGSAASAALGRYRGALPGAAQARYEPAFSQTARNLHVLEEENRILRQQMEEADAQLAAGLVPSGSISVPVNLVPGFRRVSRVEKRPREPSLS